MGVTLSLNQWADKGFLIITKGFLTDALTLKAD
jgi:hypothetical protein